MKIQFNVVTDPSDYKKEDLIETQFFIEGSYTFLVLKHDYGDTISLKMGNDRIALVDFYKVNNTDNFILNNKRHIKFKPHKIVPSKEIDITCDPKEYKNATIYMASLHILYRIFGITESIHLTVSNQYLIMTPVNKPQYYITFDNKYVVLTDKECKDNDKLPGITLSKFPLSKEKLKNVLTFDNIEDVKTFFNKVLNNYTYDTDLPEKHADIYIILRYILTQMECNNSYIFDPLLLFSAKKYDDIDELLSSKPHKTNSGLVFEYHHLPIGPIGFLDYLKGDNK